MTKYFRIRGQMEALLPLIANVYTMQIQKLKSLERYRWEVSMLSVAFHAGIGINNIMLDVVKDFDTYFEVQMPDRFHLINDVYHSLDLFFANVDYADEFEAAYAPIMKKCEDYLATKAASDLEKYYDTLDENAVYERGYILQSMVMRSTFKEWYNGVCVQRFDKMLGNSHCYKDVKKSEHSRRVSILEDIADMYNNNGLIPITFDAYTSIIEECFSVYWRQQARVYDLNITDKPVMQKYTNLLIALLAKVAEKKRYQPIALKLSAFLCVLGRTGEAQTYFDMFDDKEIHNFNDLFRNYYQYSKDVLTGTSV